jgi:hypothetical protein
MGEKKRQKGDEEQLLFAPIRIAQKQLCSFLLQGFHLRAASFDLMWRNELCLGEPIRRPGSNPKSWQSAKS